MAKCSRLCASSLVSCLTGLLVLSQFGCKPKIEGSQVKYMVGGSGSDAEVERALQSKIAFRVNLSTNRLTFYKAGSALAQWNVVTGDTKGEFHDGVAKLTPEGIFRADTIDVCPSWEPSAPKWPSDMKDPRTGQPDPRAGKVAASESERWQILQQFSNIYGPCGQKNPLGHYAIWFEGAYALHGNSAEWVLYCKKTDDRRASGGCVRNPTAKIKFVFDELVNEFPELNQLAARSQQQATSASKQTLSFKATGLPITVVIGKWPTDPQVNTSQSLPVDALPNDEEDRNLLKYCSPDN